MEGFLSTTHSNDAFNPLKIRRRGLIDSSISRYHVYATPRKYVTVEARTACEAFRESGMPNAYKIVRDIAMSHRILQQEEMNTDNTFVETSTDLTAETMRRKRGGVIIHAPKESGIETISSADLEPAEVKFEAMTLAGLGQKSKPVEEVEEAPPVAAPEIQPQVMQTIQQVTPDPVSVELSQPSSSRVAEALMAQEVSEKTLSAQDVAAAHELSEEEVKRLLGEE